MTRVKNLLFYFLLLLIILHIILLFLPFPELSRFMKKPYSVRLLDRNGSYLHVIPLSNGQRREYVSINNIPEYIKKVFLLSEDKRFFHHNGIDPLAGIRALILNIQKRGIVSGASTITMQLSRIILPHGRGVFGKIFEGINALRVEAKCGKEEIFELWINSISFGMNTIGIASASKVYFRKDVKDISELEACILAVVLRNPSFYNPLQKSERLIRAATALALKAGAGIKTGIDEEIKRIFNQLTVYEWPNHAPHFSLFVRKSLTLEELRKGKDIVTSLDMKLNRVIEDKIKDALIKYSHNRLTNGAALVLNNRTGEILAYIGSNDFYDKENSGEIDGLHVRNQPGSCLKPFLYAFALDSGFFPNTLLPDIPSYFGTEEIYIPENFNNRYHGPVRLRVALASSLNIPAVYIITRLGVENFRQKLVEIGFDSVNKKEHRFGSGLALGNAEVTLFELTRAFSIFPGKGKKINTVFRYRENTDSMERERVFSPYATAMVCQILSDNASRALGFTTQSVLNTDFPAMFKTGTSNQFGNIWALGATTRYTIGIWLGNFSGKTVINIPGSSLPAHIVVDIISLLDKNPGPFPVSENVKKISICSLSGGLATDACPGAFFEYLPLNTEPLPCNFHYRENGHIKIQYPPLYAEWAREQGGWESRVIHNGDEKTPYIRRPKDGESFYIDPSIPASQQAVKFEIIHGKIDDTLSVYINGKKKEEITYPYTWIFQLTKGDWNIMVKGRESSDSVKIRVK